MISDCYARPIVPLLGALICGILLGTGPFRISPLVYAAVASAGWIWLLFRMLQRRSARYIPLLTMLALGGLSIQPWIHPHFPDRHLIYGPVGTPVTLTGRVDSRPVRDHRSRQKFILRIVSLRYESETQPTEGKLRITAADPNPPVHQGDRISFVGRIKPIRSFKNPGGFDYERFMAFDGVWASAYIGKNGILEHRPAADHGVAYAIRHLRHRLSLLVEATPPGDAQAVMKALLLGDRNAVDDSVWEAFRRAGVSHLLAISGLHVGIVATVVFFGLTWALSFWRPLVRRGITRKLAAAGTLCPVIAYGLLVGMSPSTQRAVIMVSVFLLGMMAGRDQDPVNTLAVAAAVILIIHPPALFSISFQLSFTAVAAILFGLSRFRPGTSGRLPERMPVFTRRLSRKVLTLLAVSILATLGTLPLSMYYFNQVSLVSLPANLLLVPLVGFILVPLGLASLLTSVLSATGAYAGLMTCHILMSGALTIIQYLADVPFAAVKTVTPSLIEIGLYFAIGGCLLRWAGSGRNHKGTASGRMKIAAGILLAVVSLDAAYWAYQRFGRGDLRINVLDVGQGSAAVVHLPKGRTIMVDGGGFADNALFDVGARLIAPYLWRNKIRTVDVLVLTHPNSDHLNGLLYIAEHFHVRQVWSNGQRAETAGYRGFERILARHGIDRPDFRQLPHRTIVNGVTLEILHPASGFLEQTSPGSHSDLNANSLVLKITYGDTSFLFTGDITESAEMELLQREPHRLCSTVLMVPHHGSRSSSSAAFIRSVDPQLAVVSAGWRNPFRFPHREVYHRYRDLEIEILRTDRDGAVELVTDGNELKVSTFR